MKRLVTLLLALVMVFSLVACGTTTETAETQAAAASSEDFKIGIISSVNLNHATPAAFYAHQASRSSYYDIGLELIDSGFEYFAGGGLLKPDGHDKENPSENLYELAEAAGYKVTIEPKDVALGELPARIAFVDGAAGEIVEFFCVK